MPTFEKRDLAAKATGQIKMTAFVEHRLGAEIRARPDATVANNASGIGQTTKTELYEIGKRMQVLHVPGVIRDPEVRGTIVSAVAVDVIDDDPAVKPFTEMRRDNVSVGQDPNVIKREPKVVMTVCQGANAMLALDLSIRVNPNKIHDLPKIRERSFVSIAMWWRRNVTNIVINHQHNSAFLSAFAIVPFGLAI